MKTLFKILFLLIVIYACNDENENPKVPTSYTINGKVAKGPFISGSKVTLQPMDENLNLLGSYYTCNISDDEGSYNFGSLKLESPYALLSAEGYYFNEIEGELSTGPINLTALVNLNDNSAIEINVLTHLKKERISELILSDKLSFKEANFQAQKEVLTAFGLQRFTDADATTFSIVAGTNEAAALIVISSTLLYEKSDAEFTLFLSKLCNEFKNGISKSTQKVLSDQSRKLDLEAIPENIIDYYKRFGKEVAIKDLVYYIDWDGDGIAGNEFDEEGKERILAFKNDTLWIPAEGGKIIANLTTNLKSISLTRPNFNNDNSPGEITVDEVKLFIIDPIKFNSTINSDNNIELIVKPSERALMHSAELTVYSADGNLSSTLTLIQEENKEKEIEFTQAGTEGITATLESVRNALNHMYMVEGVYSNSYSAPNSDWFTFYEHNLKSNEGQLGVLYNLAYHSLVTWERIKYLSSMERRIESTTTLHKAILYYNMAILWGNIPYYLTDYPLTNYPYPPYPIEQLNEKTIFENLIILLTKGLDTFSSFKTQPVLEQMFFPSREVSMGMLSRMHMQLKEYDKAKSYLNKIIDSNNYSLNKNRQEALSENNKELIYGFSQENYNSEFKNELENNDYIPVLTYTEVILSAAECEYYLGNINGAEQLVSQVVKAKNITDIPESDFLDRLTFIWKQELKGTGSYFAFLKRNNLAIKILDIEEYKLLLPLPSYQVDIDINLKQNPGYN